MNNIKLSIIIVSYNNLDVLVDCLNSVIKMNDIGDQLETIVVEQSPSDEIYNYLKEYYPQIFTVRAENKGFGAGNNRGSEIASGEYLLFLNPDTILLEPIAAFAVERFEQDERLGMFGVQLLDADQKKTSSFDSIIPYGLWEKIRYHFHYNNNKFNEKYFYIQGADIFIRRKLFDSVEKFDENMFMYCEEQDLCIRVRKSGYHIAYYPEKEIVHLQGACTPSNYSGTYTKQLKSFKYVCHKNGMPFSKVIMKERSYQRLKSSLYRLLKKTKSDDYEIALAKIKAIDSILEND